jgi:hypothetical protein
MERQRHTPVATCAGLATLLLHYVAAQDDADREQADSDTDDETKDYPNEFLVPPRRMTHSIAMMLGRHVELAYTSVERPFHGWDRTFSEANLRVIHHLRAHSGYAQVKYIVQTCMEALSTAADSMRTSAAAAAASVAWRELFSPACRQNQVTWHLVWLSLRRMRSDAGNTDPWLALRQDFLRAAQDIGLLGGPPMLAGLRAGVNLPVLARVLHARDHR